MKWLVSFLLAALSLHGAEPVAYEVRFPNRVHHEAEISVEFPEVETPVLEVRMSRTSPGRYALHEFAKNVYSVNAFDGAGQPITITRPNPHQWNVSGHDGTVRVTYTLFGDRVDGTYAAIDETHAHLNIPAVFLWARGMRNRGVRVRFLLPKRSGWKVATQLKPTGDGAAFEAPSLDFFIDSPAELSAHSTREWEVNDGRRTQRVRLVVHHTGSEAAVDAYSRMVQAVVLEEAGIYRELPRFDYGAYTFLADYLPWASGDGMEHRDSTVCTSRRTLAGSGERLIGTIAHEFFHAWNVERIRPRSLEPFNLEQASAPEELWLSEGFTSYYSPLVLTRAGLRSLDAFAESLGSNLGRVLNSPARKFVSPVESSLMASLVDGAVAANRTNAGTYISYYPYGAFVGLGLDLTLRTRFPGLSLDHYMRALWRKFGRREQPFSMADLEATLGELTNDRPFSEEFFRRYIRGHEAVDYETLLRAAGLLLRNAEPDGVTLREPRMDYRRDGATLTSSPEIGSPLYGAGLDRGARITRLNGKRIASANDWKRALRKTKPGDPVSIDYERRGRQVTATARLVETDRLEVVTFEKVGRSTTPAIEALRKSWFGSKAIAELPKLNKYCPKDGRAYAFPVELCPRDGQRLRIVNNGPRR